MCIIRLSALQIQIFEPYAEQSSLGQISIVSSEDKSPLETVDEDKVEPLLTAGHDFSLYRHADHRLCKLSVSEHYIGQEGRNWRSSRILSQTPVKYFSLSSSR